MGDPIRVFCCYAEKDKKFYREFEEHAAALELEKKIVLWSRDRVLPGSDWRAVINEMLDRVDVVVFLASAALVSHDRFWEIMARARRFEHERGVQILPILLRYVDLSNTGLAERTLLPEASLQPVATCRKRDAAWKQIADRIRLLAVQRQSRAGRGLMEKGKLEEASNEFELVRLELDGLIKREPASPD